MNIVLDQLDEHNMYTVHKYTSAQSALPLLWVVTLTASFASSRRCHSVCSTKLMLEHVLLEATNNSSATTLMHLHVLIHARTVPAHTYGTPRAPTLKTAVHSACCMCAAEPWCEQVSVANIFELIALMNFIDIPESFGLSAAFRARWKQPK